MRGHRSRNTLGLVLFAGIAAATMVLTQTAAASARYLVVQGLTGESQYQGLFDEQLHVIEESARQQAADADITVLAGSDATLANIRSAFATLANGLTVSDSVQLILLGHGSYDGRQYKFNIAGPDLTDDELQQMLDTLAPAPTLILAMTSSSGALQRKLAADHRVIITATKSGLERNAPVFAQFWVRGLGNADADTDKNSLLSARELFEYCSNRVEAHYREQALLATEHAVLEGQNAAERFTVARVGVLAKADLAPAVEGLIAQRTQLEDQLRELRGARERMDEDAYLDQLEPLMLELGRLQREIDAQTLLDTPE
ncbi:MAG: hypothetical protein H6978_02760 [Gammaproteobacteria bacterium]|nr:hypothetical protein [Gammaproteobacteria bacterium]